MAGVWIGVRGVFRGVANSRGLVIVGVAMGGASG